MLRCTSVTPPKLLVYKVTSLQPIQPSEPPSNQVVLTLKTRVFPTLLFFNTQGKRTSYVQADLSHHPTPYRLLDPCTGTSTKRKRAGLTSIMHSLIYTLIYPTYIQPHPFPMRHAKESIDSTKMPSPFSICSPCSPPRHSLSTLPSSLHNSTPHRRSQQTGLMRNTQNNPFTLRLSINLI